MPARGFSPIEFMRHRTVADERRRNAEKLVKGEEQRRRRRRTLAAKRERLESDQLKLQRQLPRDIERTQQYIIRKNPRHMAVRIVSNYIPVATGETSHIEYLNTIRSIWRVFHHKNLDVIVAIDNFSNGFVLGIAKLTDADGNRLRVENWRSDNGRVWYPVGVDKLIHMMAGVSLYHRLQAYATLKRELWKLRHPTLTKMGAFFSEDDH